LEKYKLSNGVLRSGNGAVWLCLERPIWPHLSKKVVTQWWGRHELLSLKAQYQLVYEAECMLEAQLW